MQYKEIVGFSNYLLYVDGRVFNKNSGTFVDVDTRRRYPTVNITSDAGKATKKILHRLVAEHFLPAPECTGMVVNHKDGNRQNAHANNLEWITHSENTQHAHDTGLAKRAKKTTVLWPDGRSEEFASIRLAAEAAGIHLMRVKRRLRKSKNGTFTIDGITFTVHNHDVNTHIQPVVWRNLRDGSEGRYDSIKEFTANHPLTRHAVQERLSFPDHIVHGDGYQIKRLHEFTEWPDIDPRTLDKHFKRYDSLKKANHSRISLSGKRVQVKWLRTGKVETYDSQLALHYQTNVNVTKISQKLATGKECIIRTNGGEFFLLRYESDEPWRVVENVYSSYAAENGSMAVKATNVKTNETSFYVSRGECGLALGLSEGNMHIRLKNAGKVYGDYFFEYL